MSRPRAPHSSEDDAIPGPDPAPAAPGPAAWFARHANLLGVYLAQLAFVSALYAPVLGFYFMADAWNLLEHARRGFFQALLSPLGAHHVPVAGVFNNLLWGFFGANPTAWAVVLLALLAALGTALQRLGTRLLGSAPLAFLASLLFTANASFHEVSLWPVVGGVHLLAALFVVVALLAAADLADGGPARPGVFASSWRLAGWLTAAYFTEHDTLPALLLVALWLIWARLRAHGVGLTGVGRLLGRRDEVAFLLQTLLPLALLLVAAIVTRVYLEAPTSAGGDRAYWLVRGLLSVFSLHASHDALHALLTLGGNTPIDTLSTARCVGGWLLAGLLAMILVLRRASPGVSVLALWLLLQAAYTGLVHTFVPRHALLLALPAALLTLHALATLARRLPAPGFGPWGLPAFAVLLLVAGAQADVARAARAYGASSLANRALVALLLQEFPQRPQGSGITLINLPAAMAEGGIGARAFGHGLDNLVNLNLATAPGELQKRRLMSSVAPASYYAAGSVPLGLTELRDQLATPARLVVLYDGATRRPRLVTNTSLPTPDRYTAQSAPQLDWQSGAWPWLSVLPSQPFDLPLRTDGGRRFGALRFLANPDTRLLVKVDGREAARLEPDSARAPRWAVITFPLDMGAMASGEVVVTLDSSSGTPIADVFSFAPPANYTPASAPFLPWTAGVPAYTAIEHETAFPLDRGHCLQNCSLRLELLAEHGRDATVSLGPGSSALPLRFDAQAAPSWRAYRVPLPDGAEPVTLHLRRDGPQAVFLSVLRVEG